ncbi:MAG: MFS transporter, partial [Alphaproteobacteria bacterium]|nr:MFS transporter [Alphaproteobacteria bacterium]
MIKLPTLDRRIWLVLLAGCLIALLGLGIRAGFGLFLAPMSVDLGWGREIFALAIAIQNLIWGIGQPFAGMIADRYGSGRVLAGGGALYGLGVYIMAQASSPLTLHLSAGVLVGLGLAGASFAVVLAALGRVVPEEQRTLAFGIATAAGSLGQFLIVPLGQAFLSAHGWSVALVILAGLAALIVPTAGALKGRPLVPATVQPQSMRQALSEAAGHSGYLYLTAGFFVCGFHVTFIGTHLPAYITDRGLPPEAGAWALALLGLFNVAGCIVAGILGNRHRKKNLLSLIYLARAVAIALFVMAPISLASILAFAAAVGFLWLSTVPLTSAIVAQVFGPRYMATLFGIVFLSHQLGAFLGVWLGGYLFDATGSYDVVWWIGVGLGLFAALVHLP